MTTASKAKILENRKRIIPIIDTIKLCGRLALPLRGHKDNSAFHLDVGASSSDQVGNFIELLNYRVHGGDVDLGNHMRTHAKNASYLSAPVQNELIKCCGDVITDRLVKEIKESKYFSILADEASGCSNKEQMSLVIRFVDSSSNIREDFVRFVHCKSGLSGENLLSDLLICLTGFNTKYCRL